MVPDRAVNKAFHHTVRCWVLHGCGVCRHGSHDGVNGRCPEREVLEENLVHQQAMWSIALQKSCTRALNRLCIRGGLETRANLAEGCLETLEDLLGADCALLLAARQETESRDESNELNNPQT